MSHCRCRYIYTHYVMWLHSLTLWHRLALYPPFVLVLHPVDNKSFLSWKILVILFILTVCDKDLKSDNLWFGVCFQNFFICFDVMSWEIWRSPKPGHPTGLSRPESMNQKYASYLQYKRHNLALGTEETLIALTFLS